MSRKQAIYFSSNYNLCWMRTHEVKRMPRIQFRFPPSGGYCELDPFQTKFCTLPLLLRKEKNNHKCVIWLQALLYGTYLWELREYMQRASHRHDVYCKEPVIVIMSLLQSAGHRHDVYIACSPPQPFKRFLPITSFRLQLRVIGSWKDVNIEFVEYHISYHRD